MDAPKVVHHTVGHNSPVGRDRALACRSVDAPPKHDSQLKKGVPGGPDGKDSDCNVGDLGLLPGLGRSPGVRAWQPTPVFLPGESHGQRSLVGYSPWGVTTS